MGKVHNVNTQLLLSHMFLGLVDSCMEYIHEYILKTSAEYKRNVQGKATLRFQEINGRGINMQNCLSDQGYNVDKGLIHNGSFK